MKYLLILLVSMSAMAQPMLTVKSCTNCSPIEFSRIQEATKKVNEVVVSQCFREAFVKMPLIQTNGLKNYQVYDSLVHADIKIDTTMYYTFKHVLGYTLDGQMKEWINRKFMLAWSVCDLGSLLSHETSHKVGYVHDYYPTSRRPNSVPYSVNKSFDLCCKN